MIQGTNGQVWSLFAYDGKLFCGHNQGTFLINGNTIEPISRSTGTWMFNQVKGHPDWLLQGNYDGISILQKRGNTCVYRNKVEGLNISSRYFESDHKNNIYIGHEYKGIIKVKVQPDYLSVQSFRILKTPNKGKNMGLAQFKGIIYFAGKQGIYTLNQRRETFEKNGALSALLDNNEYISGKLTVDRDKMWLFTKSYIYYFTSGNFNTAIKAHKIPIPTLITNPMVGYENISPITSNRYLIGKTDGYFIINLNDFKIKTYRVDLTRIAINAENSNEDKLLSLSEEGQINHNENNIIFNYSVPQFNRFIDVTYQYQLEGLQTNWSEWTAKTAIAFKNLEPGDYTFKVRAKIANTATENIATYPFTVLKPWYASGIAVFIYLLLFIVLAFNINKSYQHYYRKQQEKLIDENNRLLEIAALENEKQLMQLRNEQLIHDVDAKNRELAVSTLSLIKKDELLKIIQEDLKKTAEAADPKNLKTVISTINNSLSKDDTWNTFKEAFDNVDKDFLKKIKALHPILTPSDLKLCAYLRLNLSSKEIAPMLNISIRSVEIKRYRLRKKLNLLHDDGLVNYILSL
jgi:DNA-binding CsgD family transcriptional regulator